MRRLRLLIVDDSAVVRRMLSESLRTSVDISHVDTAASGAAALLRLGESRADAVILDVEMPDMDGIATLREIRARHRDVPVVMFSAHTERGSAKTLEALAAGASDYVLKPSRQTGQTIDEVVHGTLLPKITALAQASSTDVREAVARGQGPAPLSRWRGMRESRKPPEIVAIACSTGGPNALAEIVPNLHADFEVPIVVVQHMPPIFTQRLAERLHELSRLRVVESAGGERLECGVVYIAPGGFHLEVERNGTSAFTRLSDAPPENSCRPSADVLWRSVARAYGPSSLGVVLTGMGQDGLLGARALVEAGAAVIAQSGPSCVVWGMPRAIEEAQLCDAVVPLADIAAAITQRVSRTYRTKVQG